MVAFRGARTGLRKPPRDSRLRPALSPPLLKSASRSPCSGRGIQMRPDPTRCLLLIDDEPAQRRLITAIGARAGWWVRGANDLDAAQKMMADPQEPKFDAILLDHWLPGDEGTELIRQLRELRPEIPLL